MDDKEYKLQNQDELSSTLVKGLSRVGDSDIATITLYYVDMLIDNAPDVWMEYLNTAKVYLNGEIDLQNYTPLNHPESLYKALQRAFEVNNKALAGRSSEQALLYYLLSKFKLGDWKAMAAYLEVEPV